MGVSPGVVLGCKSPEVCAAPRASVRDSHCVGAAPQRLTRGPMSWGPGAILMPRGGVPPGRPGVEFRGRDDRTDLGGKEFADAGDAEVPKKERLSKGATLRVCVPKAVARGPQVCPFCGGPLLLPGKVCLIRDHRGSQALSAPSWTLETRDLAMESPRELRPANGCVPEVNKGTDVPLVTLVGCDKGPPNTFEGFPPRFLKEWSHLRATRTAVDEPVLRTSCTLFRSSGYGHHVSLTTSLVNSGKTRDLFIC